MEPYVIRSNTPEGRRARVKDIQGNVIGPVSAACPEEGWLELYIPRPGGGKVWMDHKNLTSEGHLSIVKVRVHAPFTIEDRLDDHVVYDVSWRSGKPIVLYGPPFCL